MAEDGTGADPVEPDPEPAPASDVPHDPPTGTGTGETDKTEHAPLAQWASRAGGRPLPEAGSPELQAPADPWPEPIQGLVPPADAPPVEDLETLAYTPPPQLPPTLAAPADRSFRGLVAVVAGTAAVMLLVGTIVVVAAVWPQVEKRLNTPIASGSSAPAASPARQSDPGVAPSAPGGPSAVPGALETIPPGPVAQGVPPASVFDMDEICRGETYWPMLPKRAGKAPHPTLVIGDQGGEGRLPYTMFNTWFLKPKAKEVAWSYDKDPATIQLVACVDRISVGAKVRNCTYPEPNEGAGVLHRATYRVRLLETATGKKLVDTKMEAKDTTCPYIGRVPDDKRIYMAPSESALVNVLGKYVEK